MPWSTRAVIFLAFAIQLGSVSDRLGSTLVRPADCLTLCGGQLLPLWFAGSSRTGATAAETAALIRVAEGEATPTRPSVEPGLPGVALDQVGWAILPMPPPAVC